MYCKNCGNPMDNNAAVCMHCGYAKGQGERFCVNCGTEIPPGAAVCVNCGFSTQGNKGIGLPGVRSRTIAGILALLLGFLGVHNFYLGYNARAIIQLCITLGSFIVSIITCGILSFVIPLAVISMWIWGAVEGIMLLTGKTLTDGQGNRLGE